MADPNHDLEQVVPPSGHTSETELDRDVSIYEIASRRCESFTSAKRSIATIQGRNGWEENNNFRQITLSSHNNHSAFIKKHRRESSRRNRGRLISSSRTGGSPIVVRRLRRITTRRSYVERGGTTSEEEDLQPGLPRDYEQRRAGATRGRRDRRGAEYVSGERRGQSDTQPSSQVAEQTGLGS